MIRIPSLSEVVGLFVKPRQLSSALAGIERAIAATENAASEAVSRAAVHQASAEDLRQQADREASKAYTLLGEADRAMRVAERLRAIIA